MRDQPDPVPDTLLCFNLYALSHAMTRFQQPLLAELGLTYPQYLVLLSLNHADGQGVGRLSADLALETSTLSPLLKRMEAGGLIHRSRSAADERRVHVHLTPAGRAIARCAAQVPGCVSACLNLPAAGLSTSDLHRMSAMARTLRDALAQLPEPELSGPPQT